MYPSSRYQGSTVFKKNDKLIMEVVTQTNATMCFILLHGPSRDQKQKRRTRKEEETTHKCLFKFTYVIHAYIVLNF